MQVSDGRVCLAMVSQWAIGGNGWAYDISFGSLDRVVASGTDVVAAWAVSDQGSMCVWG